MSMKSINEVLSSVFRMKEESLNDNLTMSDIEKWDSLTHMDLITSIEENFDIELSMDEIMEMQDIKTIKKIVSDKVS
jgi:acyl carrier protein